MPKPLRRTQPVVHVVMHQRAGRRPVNYVYADWVLAMERARELVQGEPQPLTGTEKADNYLMKLINGREFCWVQTLPLLGISQGAPE